MTSLTNVQFWKARSAQIKKRKIETSSEIEFYIENHVSFFLKLKYLVFT